MNYFKKYSFIFLNHQLYFINFEDLCNSLTKLGYFHFKFIFTKIINYSKININVKLFVILFTGISFVKKIKEKRNGNPNVNTI